VCAHEWNPEAEASGGGASEKEEADDSVVRDSNGNVLQDGDSVTVIKELKIKGAASSIKVGTKVRNIRLTEGHDGHNISCKIDGIGSIQLKSEFVKKA
jgi:protein PhnA